jgi:D-alanyl-D-alanine carboxypeptidase
MPRRTVLFLVYCLLSAAALQAQGRPPRPDQNAPLAHTLDSLADAIRKDRNVPGLAVAVVRGHDTLLLHGYGLADLENLVPVDPGSVFRIGSLTKQFTASAIMRLVEAGRIGLDDSLARYLPDYPAAVADRVRIRQLLNHTSGIPSYTGLPRFWQLSRLELAPDSVLALFKDLPLEFEPGARWRYDNSGYYLLGLILERVTGERYADHLRRTLFEPLGLASTRYCDTGPIVPHRVQGYASDSGRIVNAEPLGMGPPFAAGALCSSAADLARWEQALMGGRVVSAASLALMTAPTALTGGGSQGYGFGLGLGAMAGHRQIAHGGGINGFACWMGYFPDDSLTVVVLTNRADANADAIGSRLARRALGIAEPLVRDLPRSAAELARYTGAYTSDIGRMEIGVEGSRLQLHGPVDGELRYQGQERFLAADDPDVALSFHLEGERVTGFTLSAGGRSFEVRRTP